MDLGCILNPGPCIQHGIDVVVLTVPWWWVLPSFIAGTIVGAVAGWLGVAAAIGGLLAFLGGRAAGHQEAAPPAPPQPQRRPPRAQTPLKPRKTLLDLLRRDRK